MSSAPMSLPVQPTSNYRKYHTKNPLVQHLIERFLRRIELELALLRPRRLIDLGAGEGMLARRLSRLPFAVEYWGLEINPDAIALARAELPELKFEQANILTRAPEPSWADVAVCLEVLEHLDEPERAVAQLCAWTRAFAIVSVPHEPFFRVGNLLRGKYVRSFGNHPEHVQQFTPKSLRRLLSGHFEAVRVERCFPWLIAVARKSEQRAR